MQKASHHPFIVICHWLTFALIMVALVLIEVKNYVPRDNPLRADLKTYHMLVGQFIFLVVIFRVIAKFFIPQPQEIDKSFKKYFKNSIHLCLYIFMIGMPITGILLMQSAGKPIPYFNDLYPLFVEKDLDLKKTLIYIHEYWGNAIYFFIGLHAIVALWREYILKDGTLQRMFLVKKAGSH
jgi:superoxide oxidase